MIRLANTPMPHVPHVAQSLLDLFRKKKMLTQLQRPAPEPDPEPNPAPDAAQLMPRSRISPDDWDDLFHAVTERLESCVATLPTPDATEQQRVQTTVLECVSALKQLQTALAQARQAPRQTT